MFRSHSAFGVLLVCATSAFAQTGIPLTVKNPASTPMAQAPVSFGVPLHLDPNPILSLDAVSMTVLNPAGQAQIAQHRVLARWGGDRDDATKPIKWVLVTFLADCGPGGTATYFWNSGPRPAGQLTVTTSTAAFTVSPAPGTVFVLDRGVFSLFRSVLVAGQQVVAAPGGALEMVDSGGTPVVPAVTETVLEENGTVRAVVRQRGTLASLGLAFTCRWYFHSGRTEVTFDFCLENPGAYGFFGVTPAHRYFDSLHLRLPVQGAGANVVSANGQRSLGGQVFQITQDCAPMTNGDFNVLNNFSYSEKVGAAVVGSGERYEGAIDVSGPLGGVTVACDRFWQNFPKALKVQGADLRIGLWPEWGHGPEFRGTYNTPWSPAPVDPMAMTNFRFEGARWKSHRTVFEFHAGARTPAQVAQAAERANRPAMGRPHPWWVKHTRATGLFMVEKRKWAATTFKRYELLTDMLADDSLADDVPGVGHVGFKGFRNRGGYAGHLQMYGWDTFGDIGWADGYSTLHYDWPLTVLLQWYRGGSYEFFDIGRDLAVYRRDYVQNHSTDINEPWRGAQFYEKGWWHGNDKFGDTAHTWVHGMLLHYAMTGDEASREAAIETMGYLIRESPRYWNGYYDARVPGWCIDNLVDLYNYLGSTACLIEAEAGIERFKFFEAQNGSHGYVVDPSTAYPGNAQYGYPANPAYAQPWMHNILFVAVARYSMVAVDFRHVDLLNRMRSWFKNECIIPSSGPPGAMTLPTVYQRWAPGWLGGTATHLLWPMSEALAYSAAIFNSDEDANLAAGFFDIATRFYQSGSGAVVDYNDVSSWARISMRILNFPTTESKIMGQIMRWSLAVPFVQSLRAGTY